MYKLLERRTYDLAGVTHSSVKVWLYLLWLHMPCQLASKVEQLYLPRPHLLWLYSSVKVWLNGKKLGCNNFAQYVDLYLGPKLKPGSAQCAQRAESAVWAPQPRPRRTLGADAASQGLRHAHGRSFPRRSEPRKQPRCGRGGRAPRSPEACSWLALPLTYGRRMSESLLWLYLLWLCLLWQARERELRAVGRDGGVVGRGLPAGRSSSKLSIGRDGAHVVVRKPLRPTHHRLHHPRSLS